MPSLRLVAPLVLLAGCNCRNDATYTPLAPTVFENDHGQWLSMDTSPAGELVVSYYDRTRGGVGFAIGRTQDDGDVLWTYEEVDGYPDDQGLDPGDRGLFTSLAVAESGRVWVAYYDMDNQLLRAAFRDGGVWTVEQADSGSGLNPDTGLWASLALDAEGNPVIAHYDAANASLRVARRSADGEWSGEEVWSGEPVTGDEGEIPASVGQFARLEILDGTEYIAFYDAAAGDLNLLEGTGGTFSHSVVATEGDVGQWPSLALDGSTLLLAFHDISNQDLVLGTRRDGAWTFETVDDGEYVGADTEVFAGTTEVGIVYFDGQFNDMRIARSSGGPWSYESLGSDGVALGYHNEVTFTNGRFWVASYDYTNRRIFAAPLGN